MNRVLKYTAALALLLALTLGLATSYAQQPDGRANHVAVVVQYGSGQVATRCVGFDEESISGYEALQRAGFGVVAEGSAGIGAMVCAIDGVGCDYPNESCGCKCEGAECIYWAYSQLKDGVWRYSTLGASSARVRDGAVEGWAWGGGSVERGASPPVIGWGEVCAAQAAAVPTAIPPTQPPPTAVPTQVPPTRAAATLTSGPTAATAIPPTQVPPTRAAATQTSGPTPPTLAPATAEPAATQTPDQPTATVAPATTPAPAAAGGQLPTGGQRTPTAPSRTGYLAFAGIAGLLGASVWLVRRRRTR